ncbi:hypothetical protein WN943_022878 [Citrus x changshan-huyou]
MATKPGPGLNPENPIRVQPAPDQFLCGIRIGFSEPAYFRHHLSHLSLYHGQQKGVDFAAVFCGLWGWILGLCSVACGGGFRGCVSRPVVVDFAACGGGFRGLWGWISQLWGWPVGVDFSAVQLKESNPGSKPGIRKIGFFRVEPGPNPDRKKPGLIRVR